MANATTYIVAVFKRSGEGWFHVGVIERHEHGVNDDAERYEEVDKSVHNEQFDDMSNLVPVRMTLPPEHYLHHLLLQKLFLVHTLLISEPA